MYFKIYNQYTCINPLHKEIQIADNRYISVPYKEVKLLGNEGDSSLKFYFRLLRFASIYNNIVKVLGNDYSRCMNYFLIPEHIWIDHTDKLMLNLKMDKNNLNKQLNVIGSLLNGFTDIDSPKDLFNILDVRFNKGVASGEDILLMLQMFVPYSDYYRWVYNIGYIIYNLNMTKNDKVNLRNKYIDAFGLDSMLPSFNNQRPDLLSNLPESGIFEVECDIKDIDRVAIELGFNIDNYSKLHHKVTLTRNYNEPYPYEKVKEWLYNIQIKMDNTYADSMVSYIGVIPTKSQLHEIINILNNMNKPMYYVHQYTGINDLYINNSLNASKEK